MTSLKTRIFRIALATVAGAAALFVSEQPASIKSGYVVTGAQAIIGRPLTPMSYAGVARRTTARAYGAAVAAPVYGAAVVAAPVVVAPVCRQVVNAYGQIVTVC